MKRSTPLRRTTRLRPESAKRRREGRQWRKVRQDVLDRANGRCEAGVEGVCTIRAEQAHHLRLRSQGGQDEGGNLLAICSACHGHIHANVAWAVEHGFIWQRSTERWEVAS